MSIPPESDGRQSPRFWRSLNEWGRDEEYLDRTADEFNPHAIVPPEHAVVPPEGAGDKASGLSRRRFMALMAASAAVGVAACERLDGRGEIIPYAEQPEGAVAGTAVLYASCLTGVPGDPPVLVTTREGRPVKIEGNPEHPASSGALGAYGQAATLSLYDPDRINGPSVRGGSVSWEAADEAVTSALAAVSQSGKGILLVTPAITSPTMRTAIAAFLLAYPTARHISVEQIHPTTAVAARMKAYGTQSRVIPGADWSRADVVLSLDADFLGPAARLTDVQGFASRRSPEAEGAMSRLWVVEGAMSQTGCSADHRLKLRPAAQHRLLLGLLNEFVVARGMGPLAGNAAVATVLAPHALASVAAELGLNAANVNVLARDLADHTGRSLVVAGDHLPEATHTLACALNATLGNDGTVITAQGGTNVPEASTPEEIAAAIADVRGRGVGVVINLGANPAYALPGSADFAALCGAADLVVSSSLVADETAALAQVVLPAAHDLESWGDSDLHADALTLRQPMIRPLFQSRQVEESVLRWTPGQNRTYLDFLKGAWEFGVHTALRAAAPFDQFWVSALHDGFVLMPEQTTATPSIRANEVAAAASAQVAASGVDVVLAPSHATYDGRFANNGWLQESPHPVTSQVWGNGAMMSRATAERLGVADGGAVKVTVGAGEVTLPAVIEPGVADDVVTIALGYGRTAAGSVGTGIGTDVKALCAAEGLSARLFTGASVEQASGGPELIRLQEHNNIHGRHIVIAGTQTQYAENPLFVADILEPREVASPGGWTYTAGHKWVMSIDVSACIGCNACQIACMAENNIPVVGPEQVARGREMHWIRVDRYYEGERPEDPQTVYQPMLCQHCDNAPCENVCPVAATAHSPEGLNEMAYNRCVGTRYCANNCPYKVRRFNFFNYFEDDRPGAAKGARRLVFNPEVTVRSRGVMEKCTFCTQRIAEGKHAATREGRQVQDGDIRTACQQACPTGAIVFGDRNDAAAAVREASLRARGYNVLGEVGTGPSITYLAKIRNPHPDFEPGAQST